MDEEGTRGAMSGRPPVGAISELVTTRLRAELGLRLPMRDGTMLALDYWRPDVPGPLPVVLVRTPYDKVLEFDRNQDLYRNLAQRGYIVAFNDCHGRFNSDGVFTPYFDEADDGYDTVEWVASQDWCDGNVGMTGRSYSGQTPWFAASRTPPHLKAIVPFASPPSTLWRNEPFFGGAFMLSALGGWMIGMGRRSWQDPQFIREFSNESDYFDELPVASLPAHAGVRSEWWDEMMQHPSYDDFWKRGSYDCHAQITTPALNITGWWDMNFPGAPTNFEAMRRTHSQGETGAAQKLIIGPWPHWVNRERALNGVDFGDDAVIELNDYVVRFFDRWLKGRQNGIEQEKDVYTFVVGANEWWAEDDWPLADTAETAYYFHSGGSANSLKGDGTLSTSPPGDEPADTFFYDPADPVRTVYNFLDGPVDDRIPSIRDDVLCYTSEPLTEPIDVVGWVSCELYAASSASDTDWHVRLVDVYPDGSARFLCRGLLRARFRDSFEAPSLLEPAKPTRFRICLDATGNRFLPGHRIRVEVTSSWFPQYDRNTNSGSPNPFFETETVMAEQTILHGGAHPSHIVLPVVLRR